MEDKISILLEVIGQEQARIDNAAKGIDSITKANQRAERATATITNATRRQAEVQDRANRAFMEVTATILAQQKAQQNQARVIDSTTAATERQTKAIQKQSQTVARQKGPSLASDPNAFFREELAKQEAAAAKVQAASDAANAARRAELASQREQQALREQKALAATAVAQNKAKLVEQQVAKAAILTETALIRKAQAQDRAKKATESGEKANAGAAKSLGNLRNALFAVQAVIVTAAVAIAPLIISINRMEDVGILSKKVGITTEAISQLSFAAAENKISFEQLSLGLKGFSKAITDSEVKGSNANRGFAALGINVRDTNGTLKGTLPLLLEVANAFSRYKDDASKATVAQFLFEESGINFIPLLNQGAAGLAQLAEQADKYGVTISGAQAKQATTFNKDLREFRQIVTGVATSIATEILPALIDFTRFLIENRTAVIATAAVVGTLVTAIVAGAAAMKAYSLAITVGTAAWAPYAAAALAATAAIIAVNEAIKAGNAAMQEQASITGVQGQQADRTKRLKAEIELLKEQGKLTEDQARRAQSVLNKAAISGDVDNNQRALSIVSNTLREAQGLDAVTRQAQVQSAATTANIKNAFAEAQKNAPAGSTPGAEKPGILLPTAQALRDKERAVQIANEMDQAILESRAKRLESEALTRLAAQSQEHADHEKRLAEINALEGQSQAEKNALLESAQELHAAKLDQIEKESADRAIDEKKRVADFHQKTLEMQLNASQETFGGIAQAIKDFGGEGTTAYKVFATAQAVIATALAAIQAYSATVGILYVGPILAPIAAGAAIAVGAAQIAKINGAFAEGGIVPGTPSNVDNRVVAVATGETIISSRATRALIQQGGMGAINALLGGQMPYYGQQFASAYVPRSSASAFATGGVVGAGPEISRGTNVDITLAEIRDRQSERDQMARDSAMIIVDKLNRRGNRLKV